MRLFLGDLVTVDRSAAIGFKKTSALIVTPKQGSWIVLHSSTFTDEAMFLFIRTIKHGTSILFYDNRFWALDTHLLRLAQRANK